MDYVAEAFDYAREKLGISSDECDSCFEVCERAWLDGYVKAINRSIEVLQRDIENRREEIDRAKERGAHPSEWYMMGLIKSCMADRSFEIKRLLDKINPATSAERE